jgi:hypothetical protein
MQTVGRTSSRLQRGASLQDRAPSDTTCTGVLVAFLVCNISRKLSLANQPDDEDGNHGREEDRGNYNATDGPVREGPGGGGRGRWIARC